MRLLAATVSVALCAALIGVPGLASAKPGGEERWPLTRERSTPGRDAVYRPPAPDPVDAAALRGAPAVSWPAAGSALVDVPAPEVPTPGITRAPGKARAGGLAVWVAAASAPAGGPATSSAPTPARVRVEVLDRAVTAAARPDALLLRVGRADGVAVAGPVRVEVDYSGFRHAVGGDWAARLRLVSLPECALRTPDLAACRGRPLPTRNDVVGGRLAAEVAVSPDVAGSPEGAGTLLAVIAGTSGSSGSFGVSSLSESATWGGGGSSGDFTWAYPLRVPPSPGGLAPDLALAYAASGVDGRTVASNSQPSWIGEGFELSPGFIERRYKPCADDMAGGNNAEKTGDLCWATDNATMSLGGAGGELIRDDVSGVWRSRNDNGARIEHLFGAVNGDDNGEYWRVTTTDGTQYYFGLGRRTGWTAGQAETNSTWTVPVYGNHVDEPCRQSTFDASYCPQAWRWQLDYVVDRYGDTMSYVYQPETNRYARNLDPAKVSTYTRGGWLERVEYGQRDGAVFTTPAVGQVLFEVASRCVPNTSCVKTNKDHFPDVPYDLECDTATCAGKFSPSFWTAKRLARVRTQVHSAAGFRDVDSWALRHSYPLPGDGTRAGLWLDGITHTGHVGGDRALPEVTFSGVQMPNRVDGVDGIPAMNWWRISAVHSESGGELAVTYSGQDCSVPGNVPAPDTNTRRCMPVRWAPENLPERLDWFNKYVVTSVSEHDRTSGLQPVVTGYEYLGGAAWRYAEADGLTLDKYRTWSQWRGYGRVKTRVGHPDDVAVTLSESLYMRGMHGDKLAGGGTKTVTVTASEFGSITDEEPLAGFVRETVSYVGDTSTVMSRMISDPWLSAATATALKPWGAQRAYVQGTAAVHGRQALEGGAVRRTRSVNTLSTVAGRAGVVTATDDRGDETDADDDKCIRYEYGHNPDRWLFNVVTRVVSYSVSCTVPSPAPADVMTDTRNYYDGSDTLGVVDKGNPTRSEKLVDWAGSTPVYGTTNRSVFDAHGRVTEAFDASGARTLTTFTPLVGGPVTKVETENALGHTVTTELEPAWGTTRVSYDINGRRAEAEYDPLGRVAKVWEPGRVKGTDTPSAEYEYTMRTDGPNAVLSRTLKHDGTYLSTYTLYDGLLRERQLQAPAPGGGRVVLDRVYNSRGELAAVNGPYYNDAPPGFDVLIPDLAQLPARTETVYDGAGRPTAEIFKVQGTEQWRTTTVYGGDRVHVTPPVGGTATTTITDSRGQVRELRQYHGPAPAGTFDATKYTYTKRGELSTVVDPVNNTWRYSYNTRGQKIRDEDPDRGATTYTYDNDAEEVATITDARNMRIAFDYDAIGRKTAMHEDSLAGPKLAEWLYDTLEKGHLTSSTRFVGGNAYKTEVTGYDAAYRPKGSRVTIPPSEGNLAGTYQYGQTYNVDGSLATTTLPAIGSTVLPAETLTYGYDSAFSLPTTLSSGLGSYVTGSTYTPYSEPWQVTTSTDATGATKWVTTTFEYHTGSRRLGRVLVERDGTPMRLSNATYTWEAAGNLSKVKTEATGVVTDNQCYKYDHLRRLTTAWTPLSGSCTFAPSAGALGGPAPYYHSWTFDPTGNRKTQTKHATGGNTTSTSTYPAATTPRPHTLSSVTTSGPGGTRLDQYTYDAAGNTRTRNLAGTTQDLEWNVEGDLVKVTEPGKVTTFLYDADGRRLIRRDGAGSTLYLGPDEIVQAAGGALSATRYYNHQDRTIAVRCSGTGNGTLYWLAADHHDTNELAIKATDLSYQRRYTAPYGEARGPAATWWPGEKGFVGGTTDAATGLTHLGAREYDPVTGRFLSIDPIITVYDPQQMNGYAYANNSPTTFSDPDGLMATVGNGGGGGGSYTYTNAPPTPAETQPAPPPKKCKPWDAICRGKQAINKIGSAAKAAGNWVVEHKTTIITVAASIGAGIACGIVTAGAAAVACAVGVGMAIGAAEYHFTTPPDKRSLGGYLGAAAIGGASALVGGGIGKLAGAAIKAGAKALGTGAKEVAKAAGRAVTEEAKSMAKGAANAVKSLGKGGGKGSTNGGGGAGRGSGGGSGKGGGCNSFVPGAAVLMADGSGKTIDQIALGDQVLATDPQTGTTTAKKVVGTIIGRGTKQLVDITVDTDGAAGNRTATITATHAHPFWLADRRTWVDAAQLSSGEQLLLPDGGTVTVVAVAAYRVHQRVHNLTIDNTHTYYVLAGETPVLVHNCPNEMSSVIGEDSFLTNAAKEAGKNQKVQRDLDRMFAQLRSGNMEPGLGNKALEGTDVLYARTRGGARLFFRNIGTNAVQIVAKASKKNEQEVMNKLRELYGQ